MKPPDLYGLVLIGGKSSRMGADKSLIRFRDRNQRQYNYDLLTKHCSKVFLSCNQKQVAGIELPYIIDSNQHGPVSGILSAYAKFPDVAWLVLACDMPYVNDKVIKKLLSHRNAEKMATCFHHDFPEPLCTIWEPLALNTLADSTSDDSLSPRRFLQHHDVALVKVNKSFRHYLINVNTVSEKNNLDI